MALGYEIGTIMKRESQVFSDERLTVKIDQIEGMGTAFVQVRHTSPPHFCGVQCLHCTNACLCSGTSGMVCKCAPCMGDDSSSCK